ncbi:hypothetical protein [Haloarcula laminariae]|uniref:hypothetical protein n=1 Tax=Haloarcula laminariae TaxID=2961577 RepID=UPI00240632D4|nr:hypothetical protein [Halomicroarcula sp. FL173]
MDDQEIRNRIVRKMLKNQIVGNHKKQIDTVVSKIAALPTHEEGRSKELLTEMVSNASAPIEGYGGGHRQNVRLTSVEDAVDYLKDNDGEVPFGFD